MKFFLPILLILYGCSSTTIKTESEVSRGQFLLLPEFMAMSMAESSYLEEIKKAENNNQLNQNTEQVERIKKIAFRLID